MELFESHDHPISDLVQSFLEAAQALVGSSDPAISEARPAELSYELDQVVSTYLEDHQLPPALFQSIQQDVLNTIAHDLINQQDALDSCDVSFDAEGNADPSAVVAAMDQHFDQLFIDDGFAESLDPGYS